MATAKRTSVTLRNHRRGQALGNRPKPLLSLSLLLTILAIPDLLTGGGIATAATATVPSGRSCPGSTKFLFPTKGFDHFFFRDILNVTYDSLLVLPLLTVWCGQKVDQAEQKFERDAVGSLNGSALVELNFSSNAPCWFELTSQDRNCADKSSNFVISPSQRSVNGATQATPVIIGAPTSTAITSSTTTASRSQSHLEAETESPTAAPTTPVQEAPRGGGNDLSPGAKAAVGVGIGLFCVAIAAMSAFLFLRRRKQRGHDTDLARSIIDHDQRYGRTGPEFKNGRVSSSLSSQRTDRTDESALYPIQPVFDGFPGSMGYEDERPLHSMTSNHSPISGPHSPTHSYNGGYWTQDRSIEREELAAARLKSKSHTAIPTVISYGPNPVTPTLTPRPNSRVAVTTYLSKGSPDSMEEIPDVPGVPVMPITVKDYPDYNNYSIPPPAPPPVHAKAPSPPRKAAAPIVVSYGPNRVTPTPLVASPTVPPDDTAIDRRFQELPGTNSLPVHHHERQFSWEADSPLLGHSHMGPLPPYASTADFEAMEKGAVRKLAEPQAQAELPPTKDGFYHYTSDIVEYELPGAAPQNEPQLPFRQYKPHHNQGPGVSSSGNVNGYADIDEQKFLLSDLLSDVEIARMREQKAVQKAKRLQEEKEARERGEEYDLGETMGASRARMNNSNNNNPNDGTTNASR